MGTSGFARLLGAILPLVAGCGLSLLLLRAELAPPEPRRQVETPAVEKPLPAPFDPWGADGASFAELPAPRLLGPAFASRFFLGYATRLAWNVDERG